MSKKPPVWVVDPEERSRRLARLRVLKMARSPHAYVRGSTQSFYAWVAERGIAVPEGPPVWICGDCHSGNLGPIASADGEVDIAIRDFDQTVVGNPAWDLLRLILSLASALRSMDLAGVTTVRMIESACAGYAAGLTRPRADFDAPSACRPVMRAAARRAWAAVARDRLKGVRPAFPLGKDFWPLTEDEGSALHTLLSGEEGRRRLVEVLNLPPEHATPVLLDAAYWVKGCSSLGLVRCAALVAVDEAAEAAMRSLMRERKARAGRFAEYVAGYWASGAIRLVDLKQAVQAVAPAGLTDAHPDDEAERVRAGARTLSPALGERMATGRMGGRSVFVRELLPQDLKLELRTLTEAQAVQLAAGLARIVGRSHGRQLDAAHRKSWAKAVTTSKSKSLDAPSWTWIAVRDLMAVHEAAYLDHCRRYALGNGVRER